MKKLSLALAVSALTASSFAAAEKVSGVDVTMNVGLASDYLFRGVSQTLNKGAVSGGLDLVHESGLYAGTWAGNVDFAAAPADEASVEMDYYVGYRTTLGDVSVDVGYDRYTYPGAHAINFGETYAKLGYMGFSFETYYSDDAHVYSDPTKTGAQTANDDATLYTKLGYSCTVDYGIGLSASIGRYDLKDDVFQAANHSKSGYTDYSIGATKEFAGIRFGLTYTDTDLTDAEGSSFGYDKTGHNDAFSGILTLSANKTL